MTGKTLIELGYKPAPWFSEAISHINHVQAVNKRPMTKAEMHSYIKSLLPPPTMAPFEKPVNYHKNINADTPDEVSNVVAVFKTMDEVMKTPTIVDGAVMPDACPAGSVGQIPVGGIAVAFNAIHPAMHSADVCCSVMMTNLGKSDPKAVLDAAHKVTHFGGGGRDDLFPIPADLEQRIKDNEYLRDDHMLHLAKTHLGTQGDGNHFMFVGISEKTGDTMMVTHHGSRGFGAGLYKKGMKVAENFRKQLSPKTLKVNAWIPFKTVQGLEYWDALQVVRDWTKLNHSVLHAATCDALGVTPKGGFWNEHNFVFKDGDRFYHAKGATPLDDKFVPDSSDGLRLVPLNMVDGILIVRGGTTANNIGFAPHGAGRNMSRSQHKRNKEGRTTVDIFEDETSGIDARFYSGNIDISELPSAYKDANAVQEQMKEFGLGAVVDRINPYGCIMAGDWQADAPWRNKSKK